MFHVEHIRNMVWILNLNLYLMIVLDSGLQCQSKAVQKTLW